MLVLTSSAFRLILSDLLNTARDFVAYGAERVKAAATVVENVTEAVEADMRSAETVNRDIQIQHESHSRPISVKETLLGRIELVSLVLGISSFLLLTGLQLRYCAKHSHHPSTMLLCELFFFSSESMLFA